jgi:hypothetical protein
MLWKGYTLSVTEFSQSCREVSYQTLALSRRCSSSALRQASITSLVTFIVFGFCHALRVHDDPTTTDQWLHAGSSTLDLDKIQSLQRLAFSRDSSRCPELPDHPVFVSFSTIPSRRSLLRSNIASLLNQTFSLDVIINVPQVFERRSFEFSHLKLLRRAAELECLREERVHCVTGFDYGPGAKLLLPLQLLWKAPEAIIIVVDDDQVYSRHLACDLLLASRRWPKHAITRMTRTLPDRLCPGTYDATSLVAEDSVWQAHAPRLMHESDLVMGTSGYLVYMSFFDNAIFRYDACPRQSRRDLFFNDDIWVSAHLRTRGIGITTMLSGVVLRESYASSQPENYRVNPSDGLWRMHARSNLRSGALSAVSNIMCSHQPVRGKNCIF